jgi:hypothetical protein
MLLGHLVCMLLGRLVALLQRGIVRRCMWCALGRAVRRLRRGLGRSEVSGCWSLGRSMSERVAGVGIGKSGIMFASLVVLLRWSIVGMRLLICGLLGRDRVCGLLLFTVSGFLGRSVVSRLLGRR